MSTPSIDTAAIPGWASDADPENDPAWPMRHVEDERTRGFDWDRPPQQAPSVEILRSVEHRRLPAVTGTSTPPSGISGAIRRLAFRRSESDWLHWLLLMGADRINVVEGVVEDLGRGRVPNIPAEMGARAEWRHNRKGLATKLGVVAAVSLTGYLLLRGGRHDAATPRIGHRRTTTAGRNETALGDRLNGRDIGMDIHPAMRPS